MNLTPSRSAILFDLDGTLVDTAPDLAASLNVCLEKHGFPIMETAQEIRQFIGGGARRLIIRALEAEGIERTDSLLARLEEDFLAHYSRNIAHKSRPFPDAIKTLRALKRRGFALGVCTNKREDLARDLLGRLGMRDIFGVIVGGGTGARKPDPEPLWRAVSSLGAETSSSVMVGDSALDVDAARAAGMAVIVVRFGYSLEPVESLAGDALMAHYSELEGLIGDIFGAVSSDGRAQRSHR